MTLEQAKALQAGQTVFYTYRLNGSLRVADARVQSAAYEPLAACYYIKIHDAIRGDLTTCACNTYLTESEANEETE